MENNRKKVIYERLSENIKKENSIKTQDKILTIKDNPDLPCIWIWESEYILFKEFCRKLEKKWNNYIFQENGRFH